jgi:hypothetical protein
VHLTALPLQTLHLYGCTQLSEEAATAALIRVRSRR